MNKFRHQGEDGASLVLVLVFVTAVSLVIGSLLFGASTSQKTTVVAATLADAVYAADSGVEFGVATVRDLKGLCPEGGEFDLPVDFAGGSDVTVTCGGPDSDEAAQGSSGYAVITFSPGPNSLTNQGAGTGPIDKQKQISGRTFVNGEIYLKADLRANLEPPVEGTPLYPIGEGLGQVLQADAACAVQNPARVDLLVAGSYECSGLDVDDIDPKPALPPSTPPSRASQPAHQFTDPVTGAVTCAAFLPGTYRVPSTVPAPAGQPNPLGLLPGVPNYLASGVYYLEDLGEISLNDFRVFGGDPEGVAPNLSDPACSDDAAVAATTGVPVVDKGVQIILGGTSWLNVDKADAEFRAYRPAGGGPGSGVSIRTVLADENGFKKSPPNVGDIGLIVAEGNNPHFSTHGLVYMPNARVELNATNGSSAQVLGGVMAWELDLNASASGTGLVVQVTGDRPRSRSKIVVEASVPVSGTKTIKSRAILDVHVDPPERVVSNAETNANTTITTPDDRFVASDVGASIFGGTIPSRSWITTFVNPRKVMISRPATASAPAEVTIDPSTRTVSDGVLTYGTADVSSLTALFEPRDVGAAIVSVRPIGSTPASDVGLPDDLIPAGTRLDAVDPAGGSATMSKIVPATGPNPLGTVENNVTLRITSRRITVTVVSWRVENP